MPLLIPADVAAIDLRHADGRSLHVEGAALPRPGKPAVLWHGGRSIGYAARKPAGAAAAIVLHLSDGWVLAGEAPILPGHAEPYERRFRGDDGPAGTWEPAAEHQVRARFRTLGEDADAVIARLEAGELVSTPFATYRKAGRP